MNAKRRIAIALLLFSAWSPSQALAFLLPADFILKRTLEKHYLRTYDGMSIVVASELTAPGSVRAERWYLKKPSMFRISLENKSDALYVQNKEQAKLSTEGEEIPEQLMKLLAYLWVPEKESHKNALRDLLINLKSAEIDSETVSIKRDAQHIVYVIGALPWENQKSQIWIDKQSFIPRRYRLVQTKGTEITAWEIQFKAYEKTEFGVSFPTRLEIYKNKKLQITRSLKDIQSTKTLPNSLFDIS